jgi:hypothetical protein
MHSNILNGVFLLTFLLRALQIEGAEPLERRGGQWEPVVASLQPLVYVLSLPPSEQIHASCLTEGGEGAREGSTVPFLELWG